MLYLEYYEKSEDPFNGVIHNVSLIIGSGLLVNSMEKRANKTFSDNPFFNLVINILIPVMILKKGSQYLPGLSPLTILILAVAFPLAIGVWDYFKAGRKNYVSMLGVLNTALTGGFAILELGGVWFAIKEGVLPLLIGLFVIFSLRLPKNFIENFFLQPQLMDTALIEQRATQLNEQRRMKAITQKGTLFFSLSFLVSALLNLGLGLYIFSPIDPTFESHARAQMLNDQIAEMTWMGYLVIALPLTVGTGVLLWWLLTSISSVLQLTIDDLMKKS